MRPKKGKAIEERLEELTKNSVSSNNNQTVKYFFIKTFFLKFRFSKHSLKKHQKISSKN